MKYFSLKPVIHRFDSFQGFATEFSLGKDDLVLTHEFIFEPVMKGLGLDCSFVFQEHYGSGEPSDEMAERILADIKGKEFRRVIAVGGGTVIDIAKLFVLQPVDSVLDVFERRVPLVKERELVIVPTTCGTGSEVTNISIFEIKARHTKMGLVIDEFYADHAVLIPKLVESLPYKFFFYSSVDALIHACESYVSPRANCYTELFSVGAIDKILKSYRQIIENGPESRNAVIDDVLIGSNFAGIAFGNAGVGAVHALSYPIGGNYHVPHGEANYIFFLEVFKTYCAKRPAGKIEGLNAALANALGLPNGADVYAELGKTLERLLPAKRLREYGVAESDIEALADSVVANQQRLLANNYAPLARNEIRDIFRRLY